KIGFEDLRRDRDSAPTKVALNEVAPLLPPPAPQPSNSLLDFECKAGMQFQDLSDTQNPHI
ncbi:MAG: hypothetical protein AAGM21_06770, partial [Pseudomonadota bacterium]